MPNSRTSPSSLPRLVFPLLPSSILLLRPAFFPPLIYPPSHSVVEINIAIIVACASTFPTFFSKTKVIGSDVYLFLRSRVLSTTASRTGAGSGASSGGGGIAARERKRSDGGSSADTLQMHGDRTRLRGGNEEVGGSYEMEAPERENMVSIVGKGNERSFV